MSGGPGPGATHEVDAMKLWAMSKGVPIEAIHLDYDGVNTKHTAKNVSAMLPKCRLLVVSHGYLLPRVKMAFAAEGVDVCTVPCAEPYVLANMPKYLLREAAALWVYYLF
mgnify:FL=1